MKSIVIYLDESGDLGWSFGAPYRRGGSSRHLTISAVITPIEQKHLISRNIRKLYKKYKWDAKVEAKWSGMDGTQQLEFAKRARNITETHVGIKYLSITAYKPKVSSHIKTDPNKLYNYMINLLLLDEMAKYDEVLFIPDPRSVKVSSGNSLHDYLQTQLWFEKNVKTQLTTKPEDSASSKGVQFADMLSGIVQQHFEDKNSSPFNTLNSHIIIKRLFF